MKKARHLTMLRHLGIGLALSMSLSSCSVADSLDFAFPTPSPSPSKAIDEETNVGSITVYPDADGEIIASIIPSETPTTTPTPAPDWGDWLDPQPFERQLLQNYFQQRQDAFAGGPEHAADFLVKNNYPRIGAKREDCFAQLQLRDGRKITGESFEVDWDSVRRNPLWSVTLSLGENQSEQVQVGDSLFGVKAVRTIHFDTGPELRDEANPYLQLQVIGDTVRHFGTCREASTYEQTPLPVPTTIPAAPTVAPTTPAPTPVQTEHHGSTNINTPGYVPTEGGLPQPGTFDTVVPAQPIGDDTTEISTSEVDLDGEWSQVYPADPPTDPSQK